MRTVRFPVADGLTLAVEISGDAGAPCVVLMHGGGQTRFSWMNAGLALVDANYRAVNYDARGHGESDWAGPGGYSLAQSPVQGSRTAWP